MLNKVTSASATHITSLSACGTALADTATSRYASVYFDYINHNLAPRAPSFGSQDYWNLRFSSNAGPFEWLEASGALDTYLTVQKL